METASRMSTEQGVIALHYIARALFAVLAVLYFSHSAGFFFALPAITPWVLAGSYLALQLLFLLARVPHASLLASATDLVILGIVILIDAGEPPPTMALLFLTVLSNGLLHGLKRFLIMLAAAEVVLVIVLPIRLSYGAGGGPLDASASASLLLLAALSVCMLYFGLMIWRNQVLARQAVENAWRDPQTGFVSRAALIGTAGWLIPLHDRLSSPLTLALVHDNDLDALAEAIGQRLRRSDIIARHDETHLALLLPCTAAGAAEKVLGHLRDIRPDLRAAVMTLHSADPALEQALHHLHTTIARTRNNASHWLAHASAL